MSKKISTYLFLFICLLHGSLSFRIAYGEVANPDQLEFFEKQVRPVLIKHCYECHSHQAEKLKAGLLLDSRSGLLRGGDSGPAIVPNDAKASLLVSSIQYDSFEMPPKGKLSDDEVKALETWVEHGACWPEEPEPSSEKIKPPFNLQDRKSSHWAWQPITNPIPPSVKDLSWDKNEVDRFILSKLESAELKPAPPVDRRGLLRRLYFDIVGLPPTIEQVKNFLSDESPTAIATVVDQLLASPDFGERWGRHWLDLVRYAESRGHEFDTDANNAYQYRDYVIRALNADIPYNEFVREHIAGDLLPKPRLSPEHGFNESVLGTGFWFLGEWVHSPVDIRKDETDRFDNMIDVMSKTFLGVTVACARCHDHKFDAISSRDYYALSGFLQSSDYRQVRFETIESERQTAAKLEKIDYDYQAQLRKLLPVVFEKSIDSIQPAKPVEDDDSLKRMMKKAPTKAYRTLVDYGNIESKDYLQDGFTFGVGPTLAGDLFLDEVEGEPRLAIAFVSSARNDPFWNGRVNKTESNSSLDIELSSGRTLHTPTFELRTGDIRLQLRGSGMVVACVDSHRQIAGPLHGETVLKIKQNETEEGVGSESIRWHSMNLKRYIGHRIHIEFTPSKDTVMEVLRVVELDSDASEVPAADAVSFDSSDSKEGLLKKQLQAIDSNDPDAIACRKIVAQWADERAKLQQSLPKNSQLAMAMLDASGEDDHVLIRGSSANPGDLVPRRFLEAIDGDKPLDHRTLSGRLELAERINDPANPLTKRVVVNRIWHHLFGRGIVPTTDDFGVLGQLPTHPELLDYLASRFQMDGQSIKQMIRLVVLSKTYQMSSELATESVQKDPKNLLWHHVPPKRLEGEAIRDELLMVAGNLKLDPFGPSVPVYLTDFMEGRGRPKKTGPSDGAGRRSIYSEVRRNFLSPFMLAFDTPSPFSTMGRRNVSNVPAQALILMNDPFVAEQAKDFAKRAIQQRPEDPEARIRWLYETAFARLPLEHELSLMLEYTRRQSKEQADGESDLTIWTDVAHALINTKEFIFLR